MSNRAANFGGNVVSSGVELIGSGEHVFANDAYRYYLSGIQGATKVVVPELRSYTVLVLAADRDAEIYERKTEQWLGEGDSIQVEADVPSLRVDGHKVQLLIAGTVSASGAEKGITITRAGGVYKVKKPWGHELWLNGRHPTYAFKEILISKGTKTSLQYHRKKRETNVLLSGVARLHYKADAKVGNEQVRTGDLGSVDLQPVATIDVCPETIHRMEAVSQILLYEVSTPHLDDVVRLDDDTGRPDGYIPGEHS